MNREQNIAKAKLAIKALLETKASEQSSAQPLAHDNDLLIGIQAQLKLMVFLAELAGEPSAKELLVDARQALGALTDQQEGISNLRGKNRQQLTNLVESVYRWFVAWAELEARSFALSSGYLSDRLKDNCDHLNQTVRQLQEQFHLTTLLANIEELISDCRAFLRSSPLPESLRHRKVVQFNLLQWLKDSLVAQINSGSPMLSSSELLGEIDFLQTLDLCDQDLHLKVSFGSIAQAGRTSTESLAKLLFAIGVSLGRNQASALRGAASDGSEHRERYQHNDRFLKRSLMQTLFSADRFDEAALVGRQLISEDSSPNDPYLPMVLLAKYMASDLSGSQFVQQVTNHRLSAWDKSWIALSLHEYRKLGWRVLQIHACGIDAHELATTMPGLSFGQMCCRLSDVLRMYQQTWDLAQSKKQELWWKAKEDAPEPYLQGDLAYLADHSLGDLYGQADIPFEMISANNKLEELAQLLGFLSIFNCEPKDSLLARAIEQFAQCEIDPAKSSQVFLAESVELLLSLLSCPTFFDARSTMVAHHKDMVAQFDWYASEKNALLASLDIGHTVNLMYLLCALSMRENFETVCHGFLKHHAPQAMTELTADRLFCLASDELHAASKLNSESRLILGQLGETFVGLARPDMTYEDYGQYTLDAFRILEIETKIFIIRYLEEIQFEMAGTEARFKESGAIKSMRELFVAFSTVTGVKTDITCKSFSRYFILPKTIEELRLNIRTRLKESFTLAGLGHFLKHILDDHEARLASGKPVNLSKYGYRLTQIDDQVIDEVFGEEALRNFRNPPAHSSHIKIETAFRGREVVFSFLRKIFV